MKKLYYGDAGFDAAIRRLFGRPAYPPEAEESARAIIEAVRRDGDAALAEFARRFDHAELTPATFRVTDAEVGDAFHTYHVTTLTDDGESGSSNLCNVTLGNGA